MPIRPTNMKAVKRILVALATVVVAAECFVPFRKREEVPVAPPYPYEFPCWNAGFTCFAPVRQNPLFQHSPFDYRTLITHIDEVCQIYDKVASCLRPSVDECEVADLRTKIQAGLSVGDFFCSVRGRSLLREVQNSVCYTDPTKLFEVQTAAQVCVTEAAESESRDQNICQRFDVAQRCLVQVATQECGEAAVEIITEFFNRIISALHENHCSDDSPQHQYLKRSFEWFRK